MKIEIYGRKMNVSDSMAAYGVSSQGRENIKKGAHVVSAKSGNDAGFVGIKI